MPRGGRHPWEGKFSSEEFGEADDLDSRGVCEQLVQHLLSKGMKELDELPRFLERLSFPDITQEFEEGTLGHGDKYVGAAGWKGLEAGSLGELAIE